MIQPKMVDPMELTGLMYMFTSVGALFDASCASREVERARIYSFALFMVSLALYVKTSYPTVPPGDSGEVCHCACSGAIMHPPGTRQYAFVTEISPHCMEREKFDPRSCAD
jgi:hypothetical protein